MDQSLALSPGSGFDSWGLSRSMFSLCLHEFSHASTYAAQSYAYDESLRDICINRIFTLSSDCSVCYTANLIQVKDLNTTSTIYPYGYFYLFLFTLKLEPGQTSHSALCFAYQELILFLGRSNLGRNTVAVWCGSCRTTWCFFQWP